MSNNTIIEFKNVFKCYNTSFESIQALNNLSFHIKHGEFVLIMGPSGSGKTTLLNVTAGLSKPTEGQIFITGKPLHALSNGQRANLRKTTYGFVFQSYNLHEGLTAKENVELPMLISKKYTHSTRQKRSVELLELVGLKHRMNNLPYELSGGERQRVGIARALANDPPIILADEPTSDVDSTMAQEIFKLFQKLNQELGKTLLITTHDVSLLRAGARLLNMLDGQIIDDQVVTEAFITQYKEASPNSTTKNPSLT